MKAKIQELQNEMNAIQNKVIAKEALSKRENELLNIRFAYGLVDGSKKAEKLGF